MCDLWLESGSKQSETKHNKIIENAHLKHNLWPLEKYEYGVYILIMRNTLSVNLWLSRWMSLVFETAAGEM